MPVYTKFSNYHDNNSVALLQTPIVHVSAVVSRRFTLSKHHLISASSVLMGLPCWPLEDKACGLTSLRQVLGLLNVGSLSIPDLPYTQRAGMRMMMITRRRKQCCYG